jgi:hypothetical protein
MKRKRALVETNPPTEQPAGDSWRRSAGEAVSCRLPALQRVYVGSNHLLMPKQNSSSLRPIRPLPDSLLELFQRPIARSARDWGFHLKNRQERSSRSADARSHAAETRSAKASQDEPFFPSATGRPDGAMLQKLKALAPISLAAFAPPRNKLDDSIVRINRCASGPFCFATMHLRGVDIMTVTNWPGYKDRSNWDLSLTYCPVALSTMVEKPSEEKVPWRLWKCLRYEMCFHQPRSRGLRRTRSPLTTKRQ